MRKQREAAQGRGEKKQHRRKAGSKAGIDLANVRTLQSHTEATGYGCFGLNLLPSSMLGKRDMNGKKTGHLIIMHDFSSGISGGGEPETVTFETLDDLGPGMRMVLLCGFLDDLDAAKAFLPTYISSLPPSANFDEVRLPHGLKLLDHAARRGNLAVVDWLCTDPEIARNCTEGGIARNSCAVAWAGYVGNKAVAELLVKRGANPYNTEDVVFDSKPTLFLAAENAKLGIVKWLVEEVGMDINMTSGHRASTGHGMRIAHGRDILEACLQVAAGKLSGDATTPAHIACHKWCEEKIKALKKEKGRKKT